MLAVLEAQRQRCGLDVLWFPLCIVSYDRIIIAELAHHVCYYLPIDAGLCTHEIAVRSREEKAAAPQFGTLSRDAARFVKPILPALHHLNVVPSFHHHDRR